MLDNPHDYELLSGLRLRLVPHGTAHFDWSLVTLLIGGSVIHATVAEGLVYQIVHIYRYSNTFTTVIGACALEQFAVDREFSDEFQLQLPIQLHECVHGRHSGPSADILSVCHRTKRSVESTHARGRIEFGNPARGPCA
jgi:hypothetical protein